MFKLGLPDVQVGGFGCTAVSLSEVLSVMMFSDSKDGICRVIIPLLHTQPLLVIAASLHLQGHATQHRDLCEKKAQNKPRSSILPGRFTGFGDPKQLLEMLSFSVQNDRYRYTYST